MKIFYRDPSRAAPYRLMLVHKDALFHCQYN
jgi:hypothetical protein